jgi:hypothetical protein
VPKLVHCQAVDESVSTTTRTAECNGVTRQASEVIADRVAMWLHPTAFDRALVLAHDLSVRADRILSSGTERHRVAVSRDCGCRPPSPFTWSRGGSVKR